MSLYIFDTDVLSLLQYNHPKVMQQCIAHFHDDLAITIISVEEQLAGWYARLRQAKTTDDLAQLYQRMTETVEMLRQFQLVSFSKNAILRYRQLAGRKLGVRKSDLRIAAIALENGATVVTRNRRDFSASLASRWKTGRFDDRRAASSKCSRRFQRHQRDDGDHEQHSEHGGDDVQSQMAAIVGRLNLSRHERRRKIVLRDGKDIELAGRPRHFRNVKRRMLLKLRVQAARRDHVDSGNGQSEHQEKPAMR